MTFFGDYLKHTSTSNKIYKYTILQQQLFKIELILLMKLSIHVPYDMISLI